MWQSTRLPGDIIRVGDVSFHIMESSLRGVRIIVEAPRDIPITVEGVRAEPVEKDDSDGR
jgi:sRNA-binding carbon storage regulator CsrA